jgi:hypothetical protein
MHSWKGAPLDAVIAQWGRHGEKFQHVRTIAVFAPAHSCNGRATGAQDLIPCANFPPTRAAHYQECRTLPAVEMQQRAAKASGGFGEQQFRGCAPVIVWRPANTAGPRQDAGNRTPFGGG